MRPPCICVYSRINRNIVECKEISKCGISVYGPPVLIETLWNVKYDVILDGSIYRTRINRNIVECKVSC